MRESWVQYLLIDYDQRLKFSKNFGCISIGVQHPCTMCDDLTECKRCDGGWYQSQEEGVSIPYEYVRLVSELMKDGVRK